MNRNTDMNELKAGTARALMSLIKLTEALEDDGCIVSAEGSVAARLLPEIFSVSASGAIQSGGDDGRVRNAVTALTDIKDGKMQEAFIRYVLDNKEAYTEEEPACFKILKEFDRQVLATDRDFYIKRGGADVSLTEMYMELVKAVTTIMIEG